MSLATCLALPLQRSRGELASASTNRLFPPALRILVVDQDATLRQRYARELTRAGFHVDTSAAAAEAGLRAYATTRYDIESHDLLVTHNESPKLSGPNAPDRRQFNPHSSLTWH